MMKDFEDNEPGERLGIGEYLFGAVALVVTVVGLADYAVRSFDWIMGLLG